jgi:hypothetical protein
VENLQSDEMMDFFERSKPEIGVTSGEYLPLSFFMVNILAQKLLSPPTIKVQGWRCFPHASRLQSLGGHHTFFNGVITGTKLDQITMTDPPASVPLLTDCTANREGGAHHAPSNQSR